MLVGGVPAHNFSLADSVDPAARNRGLEDFCIPRGTQSAELRSAFVQRAKFYAERRTSNSKPFEGVIGNPDWVKWTQNAQALSTAPNYCKDELGSFDKAIYASFCDNKEALMPMCPTWHDQLWANLKSSFNAGVIKEFVAQRQTYALLFGNTPGPYIPLAGQSSTAFTALFSDDQSSVLSHW